MSFSFPEAEKVQLLRSPLVEVICQARFAPILRIVGNEPADLQEALRDEFPRLEIQGQLMLPTDSNSMETGPRWRPPVYRFSTDDEAASVSASINSFSLSVTQYDGWVPFRTLFTRVLAEASRVYRIPVLTRLGLRYTNRITAEGCEDVDALCCMIRDEIRCLLLPDVFRDPIVAQTEIRSINDSVAMGLRFEVENTQQPPSLALVLDLDCYSNAEVAFSGVEPLLDDLHRNVYNAFRWSVTDCLVARYTSEDTHDSARC